MVISQSKIRILHLTQTLQVGGAEVLLLQYIQTLGFDKYQHYVYSIGPDGPIGDKLRKLNVSLHIGPKIWTIKSPFKFVKSLIKFIYDIRGLLRTEKIQLIQSHTGRANQIGVLVGRLSRIPTFPTVHNTMAFVDLRHPLDPCVIMNKVVDAIIYRLASRVVAVSNEVAGIVHATFQLPNTKIITVKNGILYTGGKPPEAIGENDPLYLPNCLRIIAVGALTYQKSIETLINAAAYMLSRDFKKFSILIAGEGVERTKLEVLMEKLQTGDHVKLLGLRHDVLALMKASDVLVMPSRFEGLSIAMIEAMASGLPVIASNAPGLRDYVHNEINGLLFPLEVHTALASCIMRLAENPELVKFLAQGARNSFETEYDLRLNILPLEKNFRAFADRACA